MQLLQYIWHLVLVYDGNLRQEGQLKNSPCPINGVLADIDEVRLRFGGVRNYQHLNLRYAFVGL